MAISEKPDLTTAAEQAPQSPPLLDIYTRVLSGLMLLFGFRQWAVILGIIGGVGGTFESMTDAWQIATMHFAVVDLVAAVGLWMRASWGNVVWIYAAVSEIALHTLFSETFDLDLLVVAFHSITIAGFLLLVFLGRRSARA